MHALIAFHLADVGGPSRSIVNVGSWLAEDGRVTTFFPAEGNAVDDYRALGDVEVAHYSVLTYARTPRAAVRLAAEMRRDVRMFRREIRERKPDLVIAVTTVVPALLIAARLERIPAVTWAAEIYKQEWRNSPLLRLWGGLLARMTARLSAGIVACSGLVAKQYPASDRCRVVVGYCPIGPEYAYGDRARGRERHGIGDADPCVVVAGNITRGRGQDTAIRALAEIRRAAPRARLVVAGRPHPREVDRAFGAELRSLVDELGLGDAVLFEENADMADLYAAADVVVNSARFDEPMGRVVPEALVAGRPVVATEVGAVHEVIRDGVDGLIIPRDDPAAMAAAVLELWRDPERAARMVAAGRERVPVLFGPEQDLAAWQEAFAAAGVSTPRGR